MQRSRFLKLLGATVTLAAAVALVAVAVGCGSSGGSTTGGSSDSGSLLGAGSTFANPIYTKWIDEYSKVQPNVSINYQSVGSGAGIQQFTAQTVDFGATDAPMSDAELAKAPGTVLHIPTVAGAVALSYNVPGVPTHMKLTPDVLAKIYLGQITNWNDPAIKAVNPGINFPDLPIVTVHRSDASGTTNIFTNYLSAVSPDWKSKVGASKSVNWPVGVGGKGNEGVSGQVSQAKGAIGYVELAYVKQNNLTFALIQNKAGNFVEPTIDTTKEAISGLVANMPADFRTGSVGNPDGANAYPIAGFTFILVYQNQKDQTKGKALVDFLWWGIHQGQQYAASLDYVQQPPELVKKVEAQLRKVNYNGKSLAPAS